MSLDYQELKPILTEQRQEIIKRVLRKHSLASPYKLTFLLAWLVAGCEKNGVDNPFEVVRVQAEAGDMLRAMAFETVEKLIN